MTDRELLLAYLGVTLNLSPDSIAESLYKKSDDGTPTDEIQEGALEALKSLDKERITKIKPDTKTFFDNGYKKAQVEISEKYEKMIREKTGVDDNDLKGEELLLAGLEKVAKPKLEDDKVKLHPLFISREKELLKLAEDLKAEGVNALEDFKSQQKAQEARNRAKERAWSIVEGMTPIMPKDPEIARVRKEDYLREFDAYDIEEPEKDVFIPIQGGKRVENEQFHAVDFDALAREKARKRFEFPVQEPKGNGGNQNQPGQQRTAPVGKWASKTEFEDAYFKETDREVKSKMAEEYYGSNLK